MIIGITYDLKEAWASRGYSCEEVAEFDSPVTVQAIEDALRDMGHQPERIGGLDELMAALCAGKRWDMVFNIAEGMYGFGREAVIPALLESHRIPCTFSDPLVMAVTLHKATAKRVVRDCGLNTARFAVVETPADLEDVSLEYPVFSKPVAEGTGKGVGVHSFSTTPAELDRACRALLAAHRQPVLVEEFLPGREFTVGIVGTGRSARVVGVMEVLVDSAFDGGNYGYENKANYEDRVSYVLASGREAEASADLALRSWRALDCRDGGRVDIRMDGRGLPAFIEVNPLPGLHPVDSDLPILCGLAGISYPTLIQDIVLSAIERMTERPGITISPEKAVQSHMESVA
ncbi:MAG: D-alanine--D-alanine ligase [Proteobacteria bacterium]|nr:D-alanine--D-alanine ligase [Pseudomonadota bacterium]